jgi:hypothetical protein
MYIYTVIQDHYLLKLRSPSMAPKKSKRASEHEDAVVSPQLTKARRTMVTKTIATGTLDERQDDNGNRLRKLFSRVELDTSVATTNHVDGGEAVVGGCGALDTSVATTNHADGGEAVVGGSSEPKPGRRLAGRCRGRLGGRGRGGRASGEAAAKEEEPGEVAVAAEAAAITSSGANSSSSSGIIPETAGRGDRKSGGRALRKAATVEEEQGEDTVATEAAAISADGASASSASTTLSWGSNLERHRRPRPTLVAAANAESSLEANDNTVGKTAECSADADTLVDPKLSVAVVDTKEHGVLGRSRKLRLAMPASGEATPTAKAVVESCSERAVVRDPERVAVVDKMGDGVIRRPRLQFSSLTGPAPGKATQGAEAKVESCSELAVVGDPERVAVVDKLDGVLGRRRNLRPAGRASGEIASGANAGSERRIDSPQILPTDQIADVVARVSGFLPVDMDNVRSTGSLTTNMWDSTLAHFDAFDEQYGTCLSSRVLSLVTSVRNIVNSICPWSGGHPLGSATVQDVVTHMKDVVEVVERVELLHAQALSV